jgi:Flp pilus assembly protein protease CpaA
MMSMCWLEPLMQGPRSEVFLSARSVWSTALMGALLAVCVSDLLWRRVANSIALCTLCMGLGLWTCAFGAKGFGASMVAAAACFMLAIGLYVGGVVGAADVKIFAAYGSWVGPYKIAALCIDGALFAGVLGLVALYQPGPNPIQGIIAACLNPVGALPRARKNGQTMPLTVALSAGVYLILWGGL